jgi:drug/metabolite transporter (DMT)-like permease
MWIAITVAAALAQTIRNAAQRQLIAALGTLGATLVRFLYGLPFAVAWLGLVALVAPQSMPRLDGVFLAWCLVGGVAQIGGTALLLQTIQERNFAIGVAYSKTEVVQVAVFSLVLLGDRIGSITALAVLCGTLGVLLIAPADPNRPFASLLKGLTSRSALLGLGCGACMALSSVAYRAATQSVAEAGFVLAAALALVTAQGLQTLILGGWLAARRPAVIAQMLRAWRSCVVAGLMGATASACWFTAFAMESATNVRTVGLIEIVFSYAVSRRFFKERLERRELVGIALVALGVAIVVRG